jgi:hypothetical protein
LATLPTPEPGLVISYDYLWRREHLAGATEGRKTRPSVIVLAVQRATDGATIVTVLPITHTPPRSLDDAVELPTAIKRHLGLDDARSWIVVAEGNTFRWPGFDLRKPPGSDGYAYGFLPPRLYNAVLTAFVSRFRKGARPTLRD